MKKIVSFISILALLLVVSACGKENQELTRVDVLKVNQEDKSETAKIIIDEQVISTIESSLEKVKWNPNTRVDIAKKEDVLITLFYSIDKNKPEVLYEYYIWFNEDGSAYIDSNSKEDEGFGHLGSKYADELESVLNVK